ncbi:MAG: diguanylate cyclase [Candidatus Sericytochromatia bacterium]|nr:diguanylate cyclase [Candidatus Sericytochromatia bacterium]
MNRRPFAIAALSGLVWAALAAAGGLVTAERTLYDWRMRWQPSPAPLGEILIVAFDEASVSQMRWPWSRDIQAQLIDHLAGARAVLFDVLLADPDVSPRIDKTLAESLHRQGNLFLAVAADPDDGHRAILPEETFLAAARGFGSIQVQRDPDGIVRWTRLHFPVAPQVDTAAGRRLVADTESQAAARTLGSDSIALMSLQIARQIRPDLVPPAGRIHPNFLSRHAPFQQVSAWDVATGKIPAAQLRDRIVLVGATAEGMNDVHITPMGPVPGIDYQAETITSLVRDDWRREPPAWAAPLGAALAAAGTILLWELFSVTLAMPVLLGALLGLGVIDAAVWLRLHTWLPSAAMVIASLSSLLALALARQLALTIQLRRVVGQLMMAFQQRDMRYATSAAFGAESQRRVPLQGQIQTLVRITEAFYEEWRFLQTLIETNQNPVLVCDEAQTIILSNSAGKALFGPEAVGQALQPLMRALLDAETLNELEAAWDAARDGRGNLPPLIQWHHQALEVNFLPLTGGRGTLCLFEDVTALHRRANTDGLTGLWNRRYLDEKLTQELARFQRYGADHPVGLILLDIDHFKKVNDSHGHLIGDLVLRQVAELLQQMVRTTDLAVRYGGEEMCVLLTHTDLAGSMILAERLRQGITELTPQDATGQPFQVSASFGVAVSLRGDMIEAMIGRADQAMYQSKAGGRNRVTGQTLLPGAPVPAASPPHSHD